MKKTTGYYWRPRRTPAGLFLCARIRKQKHDKQIQKKCIELGVVTKRTNMQSIVQLYIYFNEVNLFPEIILLFSGFFQDFYAKRNVVLLCYDLLRHFCGEGVYI